METNKPNPEPFDEQQSLQVIKDMIQVAHKKLKNDGILFIIWGWAGLLINLSQYLSGNIIHTYQFTLVKRFFEVALELGVIIFTLFYMYRQSRKSTTYIGISLRYVWISLVIGMILINLIQASVLHKITFEFQHPVFMVFIAFALVVTGAILRFNMLIIAGSVYGLLAYICSFLPLQQQFWVESIGVLIAFVIPGHVLLSKRNAKQ